MHSPCSFTGSTLDISGALTQQNLVSLLFNGEKIHFLDNYSNISVAEPNRIIQGKLTLGKGTTKPFGTVNRYDDSLFWTLLIKQSTTF